MTNWLQRQLDNVERDTRTWPDWKLREVGLSRAKTPIDDFHERRVRCYCDGVERFLRMLGVNESCAGEYRMLEYTHGNPEGVTRLQFFEHIASGRILGKITEKMDHGRYTLECETI